MELNHYINAMYCTSMNYNPFYNKNRQLHQRYIKRRLKETLGEIIMRQPLMLQSDCADCKHYEGFGQCYEHGNNLIENCIDYRKE
jgi:hypothetical protein